MAKINNDNVEDIAFIGAGISTAYAILGLLEFPGETKPIRPLKITILDSHPDFFKGIPYGNRSGKSVLLINALNRFIPEPQRGAFVEWLNKNKKKLIEEFLAEGGVKSQKWLKNNQSSIDAGDWDSLYIPRFYFGRYISEKLHEAISYNEKQGALKVTYVSKQVDDIDKIGNHYAISTTDGNKVKSRKVVLSIGSLPTKRIFGNSNIVQDADYLMINDLYETNLTSSFGLVKDFLKTRQAKNTNLLVLGANASALEALYKFTDEDEINQSISSISVLSSQGVMPDSEIDLDKQKKFVPSNLIKLEDETDLSAEKIAKAAYRDLENAREMSLGAASTVDVISKHVGGLLPRLDYEEAKIFACQYGNSIGRMQRCAGSHYTDAITELNQENKLRHLGGRFSSLVLEKKDKSGLILEYTELKSGQKIEDSNIFQIVINCMGATDLFSPDTPKILRNLIQKGLIKPNSSKIGLDVDSDFQAAENFYIVGPLLAGNVIDKKPLWHLEHCGRIIWSSTLMAKRLRQNINPLLV